MSASLSTSEAGNGKLLRAFVGAQSEDDSPKLSAQ
jgi:hypothetical protein